MLREILNNSLKTVDATYVAHADLKRGVVVAKGADHKTAFPAALASNLSGLFLVDREPIDEGEATFNIIKSDVKYDDVAEGKFVKLVKYLAGEIFATDQIDGEVVEGNYVTVTTEGKIKASAENAATSLICRGTVTDGVTTLHTVEVL